MSAQSGGLFLLKIKTKDSNYQTIGGLRTTRFMLNNNLVDATNKTSGGWRDVLPGGGIKQVSISGSGIFTDSASERKLRELAFENKIEDYQLTFGNGEKLEGSFQISSYERAGNYNDEEVYSLTLESSGMVTYY